MRAMDTPRQPPAYAALLGVSLLCSIAAVLTLIPSAGASKPNVLGYRSLCTFAPAATALCGLAAGITCVLRNRLVSARRASTRFQPPFVAIVVLGGLITLAVVFGVRYGRAETRFGEVIAATTPAGGAFGTLADGTRTATVTEGEVSATVEVTAAGGKVTGLRLMAGKNVEQSVADTVFAAVIGAQSTAVDAVSGATATSNVLLSAIESTVRR